MNAKNSTIIKYYIAITLSMAFWGLSFIWFKIAVEQYEPFTIIFFRLILSSLFLFLYIKLSHNTEKIDKKDYKWFLLLALTEPFCYFLGESFGLKYVSSTVSSTIIATIPLATPIVAYALLREKVGKFTIAGIIISFSGIVYMLLNRDFSLNANPKGVGLLFVAVFSAVAYSFFIKKLANRYKATTILLGQNVIGAIWFFPLFMIFDFKSVLNIVPTTGTILAILQLALFASSIAYVLFIVFVANMGMIKANIFTNMIPVFTAVFAYIILGEIITLQKVIGILLVIGGIVISQLPGINQIYFRNRQKLSNNRKIH